MLAICSLCKSYIVKAIQEQQTMTPSDLPEIILTPAEENTPDVSFHTKHDFSHRGGSGGSLRHRRHLAPDSNYLLFPHSNYPWSNYVCDTGFVGGGRGRGEGILPCISYMGIDEVLAVTSMVFSSLCANRETIQM